MKILDRYVIKQFLLMALFGLVAFVLVFVVIDMMENLDDFIDKRASFGIILRYYVYFMPEMVKLMIPVAMLLSSLFTTSRMSTLNELTAVKSSGVSIYRFMTPLLLVAFVVSVATVFFNGWLVPAANKKKFALERIYLQKHLESQAKYNLFMQESPTRLLAVGYFDSEEDVAHHISMQDFSDSTRTVIAERFDARRMRWNASSKSWTLENGMRRVFAGEKEFAERFDVWPIGRLHFVPEDIEKKQEKPDEMNYPDLRKFIENQRRSGNEVSRWLVELYGKISFPFTSFIVVFFGVPFSSTKRRSGLAVEFGISIGICFIYLLFMKTSQVFGYNGSLDPFVTAWLANCLFLAAGIVNLARVRK